MILLNVMLFTRLSQVQKSVQQPAPYDPYAAKLLGYGQELLLKNMKAQLASEGQSINVAMKIKGSDSNEILLGNVVGERPKLIFRFSELNCTTCVDSQFYMIKKYQQIVGASNIIILTSSNSERNAFLFNRDEHLQCPVYSVPFDELGLPIEDLNIPYYFIVDKDLTAKLIHIPAKELPLFTDEYFSVLIKRFFRKPV